MAADASAAIGRAIERLQGDGLPFLGGMPSVTRVLSVATRPFSYVARVERESPAARRRVIVKVPRLKPGKADARVPKLKVEIAAAKALAFALKGQSDLSVPEVVAFYPEIPALVWDEVAGDTLDAMLSREARGVPDAATMARLERAMRGAGRWLRVLQDGTEVDDREFSVQQMLEYVDVRLQRIGELGPAGLDAEWRQRVHRAFAAVGWMPADRRLTAIHGDFSLSNIMHDGRRVVAIDFSRFGVGSIYYDITRVYHQLGLLLHKPWFRPSTVARLRQALLDGYDPALGADHPPFQLFLVQHLLCHWLGLLKTAPTDSWQVRAFNRWVGYCHRRELAALVGRLHS